MRTFDRSAGVTSPNVILVNSRCAKSPDPILRPSYPTSVIAGKDEYDPIDAEQEQPHLVDGKLERAGNQILQACAAKGVDVIRLFQCADVGPDFYGTTTLAEEELLHELETICFKEGVTLADLEASIIEQPQ